MSEPVFWNLEHIFARHGVGELPKDTRGACGVSSNGIIQSEFGEGGVCFTQLNAAFLPGDLRTDRFPTKLLCVISSALRVNDAVFPRLLDLWSSARFAREILRFRRVAV